MMEKAPSLQETLQLYLQSFMEDVHTCLPGRIESYDPTTRKAVVQPTVSAYFQNGEGSLQVPSISGVPVMVLGNSVGMIDIEIQKGDGVLLVFAETGIGSYIAGQTVSITPADDAARHNLGDCIALPFLWPFSAVPTPSNRVALHKDGSISLKASSGASLALTAKGKVALGAKQTDLETTLQQVSTVLTDLQTLLKTFMTAAAAPPVAALEPTLNAGAIAYTSSAATTLDLDIPKLTNLLKELF